jgi:hypothetical protein
MVIPNKSGWLVGDMNTKAMIKELNSILKSDHTNHLRETTRENAQILFNEKKVADNYVECFNHSLSK